MRCLAAVMAFFMVTALADDAFARGGRRGGGGGHSKSYSTSYSPAKKTTGKKTAKGRTDQTTPEKAPIDCDGGSKPSFIGGSWGCEVKFN